MKFTRIYVDDKGDSHFADHQFTLQDKGIIGRLSQSFSVRSLIFRENDSDYDWDFHHAPQRQFIILLDGAIEIETSLGDKRQFFGGDILLVEDTHGKGHKTRNIEPTTRRSIFITLPD